VAVSSGLEPGELVVLEGLDRLRDGKEVTMPDAERGAESGNADTGETSAAGERGSPPHAAN